MSNDKIVFSTIDPLGNSIVLKQSTWDIHIVARHTAMAGNESAVQNTIENPRVIYRSSYDPNTALYFSKEPESSYPHLFTRVVVGYSDDNNGIVKTAFFPRLSEVWIMKAYCSAMKNIEYNYDKHNDVFYLSLGAPRPSYGDDLFDGVVAMYDMDTDELTGVTIIGYKNLVKSKDPRLKEIPIAFDFLHAFSF